MNILEPGCSIAQIIEKINEIVTWINTREQTGVSYNDLSNKPCIDGIELTEYSQMKDFPLDSTQLQAISADLESMVLTVAGNVSAEIAAETAETKVQQKLDIEEALETGTQPQGDWKIMVHEEDKNGDIRKYWMRLNKVASYTDNFIKEREGIVIGG